ncbi:MAG: T9SS type A sorting domain-containing protein [Cyclobacteriaceae bacterium]|nr:T9SS type A sorting domain-containing protein [Cyclobacteriaceae bacterium]
MEGLVGIGLPIIPIRQQKELIVSFESTGNGPRAVLLYDGLGNLVSEQNTSEDLVRIETANIPKGKYFLHVVEDGKNHKSQVEVR